MIHSNLCQPLKMKRVSCTRFLLKWQRRRIPEIAATFRAIAEPEKAPARFKIGENIENDTVFKKAETVRWKCGNCGYIHEGPEAPEECPACIHPQGHFEVFVETY